MVDTKAALRNHTKVLQILDEEGITPTYVLDNKKEQGITKNMHHIILLFELRNLQ